MIGSFIFGYKDIVDSNKIILHLSLIEGVGPSTIETMIARKPWDLDLHDLYQMSASELVRLFSLSFAKAQAVVEGLSDKTALERELDLIDMHNINWMTLYNDQYPALLKNIHMPPIVLYWQGSVPSDGNQSLSIIGSRKINYYGISVIESFVPTLVSQGWTIVSGGAIGADTIAHRVTVDSGGRTVVVMGSGLLNPYPASNRRLFADILDTGGTLLSAFPLTFAPLTGNFPARNRIIAGLSRGCLVVQASAQSGTRITAHYAMEQGRELFAVPGPIDDELSIGCHSLIQEGAKLVTSVSDILVEFGHEIEQPVQLLTIEKEANSVKILPETSKTIKKPSFKADGPGATILRCCSQPCSLDDLANQTGLSMSDLYAQLFELELSGAIRQQANGMWQRL